MAIDDIGSGFKRPLEVIGLIVGLVAGGAFFAHRMVSDLDGDIVSWGNIDFKLAGKTVVEALPDSWERWVAGPVTFAAVAIAALVAKSLIGTGKLVSHLEEAKKFRDIETLLNSRLVALGAEKSKASGPVQEALELEATDLKKRLKNCGALAERFEYLAGGAAQRMAFGEILAFVSCAAAAFVAGYGMFWVLAALLEILNMNMLHYFVVGAVIAIGFVALIVVLAFASKRIIDRTSFYMAAEGVAVQASEVVAVSGNESP